mmetsp:Transcript_85119/g.214608  ORF Transcript_85119/g.214608 Transcript_85119/m.214608 type:complete len:222 (+) Transcript_85119:669-1334(+)
MGRARVEGLLQLSLGHDCLACVLDGGPVGSGGLIRCAILQHTAGDRLEADGLEAVVDGQPTAPHSVTSRHVLDIQRLPSLHDCRHGTAAACVQCEVLRCLRKTRGLALGLERSRTGRSDVVAGHHKLIIRGLPIKRVPRPRRVAPHLQGGRECGASEACVLRDTKLQDASVGGNEVNALDAELVCQCRTPHHRGVHDFYLLLHLDSGGDRAITVGVDGHLP